MASLIKSSLTISFYTLASRLLGFVRDVIIAAFLGASWLSDAFFVAFKIPNFLRRLFAEGAFNAAFIPLFAGTLATEGEEKAKAFASEALSFLVTILIGLSIICVIAMPWLLYLLAPGFVGNAEKYDLTVLLTRITFPYIIFISVVSLLGGILNSFQRFAAVAAAPIILNLCLIIVPYLIAPFLPTYAHALAISVFIGGIAQMIWLISWCAKLGVMPTLKYPRMTAEVKRLLILIAPAAAGAGVAQINLFIDLIIASNVENGVSYLYYADRINQLPLGVIGIAVGTALLPMLSRQIREGKLAQASHSQNRAIEFALLMSVPAAIALVALAEPIIRILYERNQFTSADTLATYPVLMVFALGLPAFVLVKILSPMFFANRDTKTPFYIAIVCIAVNLALNLALIVPLKHFGMAIATTTAGWLNVWLMMRTLKKRRLLLVDAALSTRLPRILIACLPMLGVLYSLQWLIAPYWQSHFTINAALLLLLCAAGIVTYLWSAWKIAAIDPAEVKRGLARKR